MTDPQATQIETPEGMQRFVAIHPELGDAIVAYLKKKTWEEVNDILAPLLQTARVIFVPIPKPTAVPPAEQPVDPNKVTDPAGGSSQEG